MPRPPLPNLPIDAVLPELRGALAGSNRAVLVAQPGAGKTTRVPLMLLEQTPPQRGRWLLLEPRRVAARLAAAWMAQQLGEPLGRTVGYRVRGEQKVSGATRLEVVTQGILTRMIQDDPTLEGVAGIIFDEFHERSLDGDLGLALALDLQGELRQDLKLLVMSATLDVDALLGVLGADAPAIDCPGRTWPVTTHYRPQPAREVPELHRTRVIREVLATHQGNLLVFLPGQAEIRRLERALRPLLPDDIDIQPLHGQLALTSQQAALRPDPTGRRRIILATAIAESSLTVPGVRVVVDAGLERVPAFQPRSGLTRLDTRRVNRASADQRRGRAGREAEGHCYRLWSREQLLVAHGEPEILQADLSGLAFELALWGLADPQQLRWVTPPPASNLASGRRLLQTLGMLDERHRLTPFGHRCARWPAQPRLAALLETAATMNALPLACWLVAWLEEEPPSEEVDVARILEHRPRRDGPGAEGRWWRAARQWQRRADCPSESDELAPLPVLLAHAFPDRVARQSTPGRFKLASGGEALLPETCPLAHAAWLVAPELDGQASGARIFHAIAIDAADLQATFPELREWRERITWDDDAGRLVGESVRALGQLIVERRPLSGLPPEAIRQALLDAARRRGSLKWTDDDVQLLGRLRLVRRTLGDPWPAVDDARLLATIEDWLGPRLDGVTRLDQLDRLPLGTYLLDSLDWSLRQRLEELAPTHLTVPSGSRLRIDYSGDEPLLAVKLQEMFGQTATPLLVGGRVPVVMQLLSPARRPVQVTRDLASFWASTYFEVRKDLKGRYPKHPWPDDPLSAPATARARRR
ncbi:MAG: ATP-dependent helicase HrpB [Pseudomonadales bacterium]